MTTLHLPPMPEDAEPVIVRGLLSGLGLVESSDPLKPPAWVTNPDLIASIEAGYIEIPEDFR